jgi:hypothetical protein
MHAEITRRWEKYNQDFTKTQAALKAKEASCVALTTEVDELKEKVCALVHIVLHASLSPFHRFFGVVRLGFGSSTSIAVYIKSLGFSLRGRGRFP